MAKVVKISVTVDSAMLDDLRRLRPGTAVSFLVDEALAAELTRVRLKALLDAMDARDPIPEDVQKKADALWEELASSIPERSPRSRKATGSSEPSSNERLRKKAKSSSPRSS